ncbi:triosephosphate isomerase [Aureococcus anophagefferens]|nr:triosephosphate isomerase [Aureococcus anophagefferens]
MSASKLSFSLSRVASARLGAVRGMARKPIVGGNWKCNPATASSLPELVSNFDGCAAYLDKCDVYVAPQNCNFGGCGAYTGEMAVDQVKDMGMDTVLIGHSERRGEFACPRRAERPPRDPHPVRRLGERANAALSAMPDIDGFLVGGASMKAEFVDIVAAIAK